MRLHMSVCSSSRALNSFAGSRKNIFEEFIIKTCKQKRVDIMILKHFDVFSNSVGRTRKKKSIAENLYQKRLHMHTEVYVYICHFEVILNNETDLFPIFFYKTYLYIFVLIARRFNKLFNMINLIGWTKMFQ